MKSKLLNTVTCVITRPKHQTKHLQTLLTEAGAHCIAFPALAIKPLPINHEELTGLLSSADKAIFVSANAVLQNIQVAQDTTVFAIGEGTKNALKLHDIETILPEKNQFNSEGLLAHPLLQSIAGEHIVIFSGEGGRKLLLETLRERGAFTQQIPVYRRIKPEADITELVNLLKTRPSHTVDFLTSPGLLYRKNRDSQRRDLWIISTSNESLKNLYEMATDKYRAWLLKQRLLVISTPMQLLAHDLGFLHPALVASNASDFSILVALCNEVSGKQRQ